MFSAAFIYMMLAYYDNGDKEILKFELVLYRPQRIGISVLLIGILFSVL
jgi:hypothetical protein